MDQSITKNRYRFRAMHTEKLGLRARTTETKHNRKAHGRETHGFEGKFITASGTAIHLWAVSFQLRKLLTSGSISQYYS